MIPKAELLRKDCVFWRYLENIGGAVAKLSQALMIAVALALGVYHIGSVGCDTWNHIL